MILIATFGLPFFGIKNTMYQKQLISLQKNLSSLGVNFQIESVGKKALSRFPCPKLREQIHLHGYPSGFTMDSHRNGFKFYGIGNVKSEEIAHAGPHKERNILYIDIYNRLGAIYWAPWFTSKWEFYIAENMAQFFLMLETFSSLFFEEYKNAIRDKNFNIMAKECNTIRYEITKITKEENVSNDFLRFMLTDGLMKT